MSEFNRDEKRGKTWEDYIPLTVLYLLSFLVAFSICSEQHLDMHYFMHYFMGFFLVSLSMFKFFDIQDFVNGFHMYDLLAKRIRAYGFLYPFIELALGLLYFSFMFQEITYTATIIVMLFGSFSILIALKKGLDLYCPCMGSILKVPLSTVSLSENLLMALMAMFLLFN